jgi:hypothetical protein
MNKNDKFSLIIFITIIVLFFSYLKGYRYFVLKDFNETFAIYKGVMGSAKGKRKVVSFRTRENVSVSADIPFNLKLDVGDTIWIKYSKYDPTIVEVVDSKKSR